MLRYARHLQNTQAYGIMSYWSKISRDNRQKNWKKQDLGDPVGKRRMLNNPQTNYLQPITFNQH